MATMRLVLLLLVAVHLAVGDDTGSLTIRPAPGGVKPCACTALYAPVCGVNGETYSNAGCADCAQIPVKCKGKCPCKPTPKPCICTKEYAPVCSTTGKTFGNACEAECSNARIACRRACPCKPTPKPCNPAPLCFRAPCTGITCPAYPDATCVPVPCSCTEEFFYKGSKVDCNPPPPDCICTAQYDPVCGVDGKTYSNSCFAGCKKVAIACDGECPCKKKCLAPFIKCGKNPCEGKICRANPKAECKPDYCRGCNAYDFFYNGKKVNCDRKCGVEGDECILAKHFTRSAKKCCPGYECCKCTPIERPKPDFAAVGRCYQRGKCPACKG